MACCKCRTQLLQSSTDDAPWKNKNNERSDDSHSSAKLQKICWLICLLLHNNNEILYGANPVKTEINARIENEKEKKIIHAVNINIQLEHQPIIPVSPSDTSTGNFKSSQITQSFNTNNNKKEIKKTERKKLLTAQKKKEKENKKQTNNNKNPTQTAKGSDGLTTQKYVKFSIY